MAKNGKSKAVAEVETPKQPQPVTMATKQVPASVAAAEEDEDYEDEAPTEEATRTPGRQYFAISLEQVDELPPVTRTPGGSRVSPMDAVCETISETPGKWFRIQDVSEKSISKASAMQKRYGDLGFQFVARRDGKEYAATRVEDAEYTGIGLYAGYQVEAPQRRVAKVASLEAAAAAKAAKPTTLLPGAQKGAQARS